MRGFSFWCGPLPCRDRLCSSPREIAGNRDLRGCEGAADRTLRLPVPRLRPRALSDAPSFVALDDVLVPIQSDEALLA